MNYTIIHKSGWQSDTTWRLGKTFSDKRLAEAHASTNKSFDARSDWYDVKILAHRNPVKVINPGEYRVGSYTAYD